MAGRKWSASEKQRFGAVMSIVLLLSLILFVIIASSLHGNEDASHTRINSNSTTTEGYEQENISQTSDSQPIGTIIGAESS